MASAATAASASACDLVAAAPVEKAAPVQEPDEQPSLEDIGNIEGVRLWLKVTKAVSSVCRLTSDTAACKSPRRIRETARGSRQMPRVS